MYTDMYMYAAQVWIFCEYVQKNKKVKFENPMN